MSMQRDVLDKMNKKLQLLCCVHTLAAAQVPFSGILPSSVTHPCRRRMEDNMGLAHDEERQEG